MATGYGTTIVLQSAVATAVNGAVVGIGGLTSFVVEIVGTFAGLTANFEASLDGVSWSAVALLPIGSTTPQTLVAAATAAGLYRVLDCRGLRLFRARTSGSTAGSMTVTVYGVSSQLQL